MAVIHHFVSVIILSSLGCFHSSSPCSAAVADLYRRHVTPPCALLSPGQCLLSPSAFNLAFKYVGFYEQQGSGVDWSTWTVSPVENDEFSLALTMLLMLLDILLYAVIVWYAEAVCPGTLRNHWTQEHYIF